MDVSVKSTSSFWGIWLAVLLLMPAWGWAASAEPLFISTTPPIHDPNRQHKQESEHRPVPLRTYWVSSQDASKDLEAYLLRASGILEEIQPELGASGLTLSFATPMGEGPAHGVHNLYLIAKHSAGGEQIIRIAKWITIHHSCGWGHDHKYDERMIQPQSVSAIPLEIVGKGLWDGNFHSRVRSGDHLEMVVQHYGKPVEGAKVKVITAKGWQKEQVTGKDGKASFQLIRDYYANRWSDFSSSHRDRFSVVAEYAADDAGENQGESPQRVRLISTLSWVYSPSRKDYSSLASGLAVGSEALIIAGVGAYAYREKRRTVYQGVQLRETD